MITVLSVEQGNASNWASSAAVTPALLKSRFTKDPYRFVHVPVPDTAESNKGKIPYGVAAQAARDTPGKKILLGNSTGCAYLSMCIRNGVFNGIPADDLEFWFLANPERKYGGWTRVQSPMKVSWDIAPFGTPGIPEDIPWQVHDFAQRYDVVSDSATVASPGIWYKLYAGSVGLALHPNYFTVSPDDSVTKRYRERNINYYLHSPYIDAGFEQSYTRPKFV